MKKKEEEVPRDGAGEGVAHLSVALRVPLEPLPARLLLLQLHTTRFGRGLNTPLKVDSECRGCDTLPPVL